MSTWVYSLARPVLPIVLSTLAACFSFAQSSSSPHVASSPQDWPEYGGFSGQHFSPLRQINAENVNRLEVKWQFDMQEAGDGLEASPIVIGSAMYICTPLERVVKLNAETGKLLWKFDSGISSSQPCRGVTYWSNSSSGNSGNSGNNSIVFAGVMNFLYALNASSGKPVETFGDHGRIDLRKNLRGAFHAQSIALTTPGVVYKDLIIVGGRDPETYPAPPGDIRAFDVHTGALRWTFHTIPHPGEAGEETWPPNAWTYAGAANNWAGMAIDRVHGTVFVPTGSAVFDFYGGDRTGDNLYANSLLALDASTGKLLWHFQAVHHDIWDRDLPSPPSLVTVMRNGRMVEGVAQTSKSGFLFVLNRKTGKPLFPIEERPVPPSTVPGEHAARTQPFPVLPDPFARQGITAADVTTRTPEAHAWALADFQKTGNRGQFVPLELNHPMLLAPGMDGGAEWGGSAYDPTSHILYVNANNIAYVAGLLQPHPASTPGEQTYRIRCALCHGIDRLGQPPSFPSLVGVGHRLTDGNVTQQLSTGKGRMPAFPDLTKLQVSQLLTYLHSDTLVPDVADGKADAKTKPREMASKVESSADRDLANRIPYTFSGYKKWLDPDGYPAVAPPWGTLNAIDLNTGKYLWRIPFGTYPELVAKGMKDTGSENYGGPLVTASGLLFIGATTQDSLFHAFDARTGKLLWQHKLPLAGLATPACYEVNGHQYVAIPAGGGKDVPPEKRGGILVVYGLQ